MLSGSPSAPLVTVANDTVAATPDFRFATLPGMLLLPLWIAGIAFAALVARAGDRVRAAFGITRTGSAEVVLAAIGAMLVAAVITVDVALFTWHWDADLAGLFAFLWLGLTAIAWLLLGLVRAFGVVLGGLLGVCALFLQQPISGAAFPVDFAPDVVRWAQPYRAAALPRRGHARRTDRRIDACPTWRSPRRGSRWPGSCSSAIGMARLSFVSRQHPAVGAPQLVA